MQNELAEINVDSTESGQALDSARLQKDADQTDSSANGAVDSMRLPKSEDPEVSKMLAELELKVESDARSEATETADKKDISLLDWISHGGDTLARMVAKRTANGGLMLLGPMDGMRGEAENYRDPDGYFPVFTHADNDDFHIYFGRHGGRKEYSVETMAELIKDNVPEGQAVRLLGCESGVDGGIARELARLLPDNPLYAPNGFCQLKDGKATVLLKKPSEMPLGQDPPRGKFVRVKP